MPDVTTGWVSRLGGGMALVLVLGSAGCATKGFVRSQADQLRNEMKTMETRLDGADERIGQTAGDAMDRADGAYEAGQAARDLALGRVGFEEVSRNRVYFGFDRAELDADGRETLESLSRQIAAHPEYVVDIYGFADPAGSEEYNAALARRRAEAVERFLVDRSFGQLSRFRSMGFGEAMPTAAGLGQGKERRQVLIVLLQRKPANTKAQEGSGPGELSVR